MGFAHCSFFLDRLYNFLGSGLPDPTLDIDTLQFLISNCPQSLEQNTDVSADPKVNMNQNTSTPFRLDNTFYQGLLNHKAVLQLDQELAFNATTLALVMDYLSKPDTWRKKFAKAMIKMTTEELLPAGEVGEIRINCRVVNNQTRWFTILLRTLVIHWRVFPLEMTVLDDNLFTAGFSPVNRMFSQIY